MQACIPLLPDHAHHLPVSAPWLQANNELWLGLVLTHPAVFGLTASELAGLLGALLSGEVLKRPGINWVAYPASPKVRLPSPQNYSLWLRRTPHPVLLHEGRESPSSDGVRVGHIHFWLPGKASTSFFC